MTAGPPDGAPLEHELADARVDVAAAARRQGRWTAARAAAERTMVDALVARLGAEVRVALSDGTEHRGSVRRVGQDAVELTTSTGATIVVLHHVVVVRAAAGPAASVRSEPSEWSVADVLADLEGSGRPVRLGLVGGHVVSGEIVTAGRTVGVGAPDGRVDVDPTALVWMTTGPGPV